MLVVEGVVVGGWKWYEDEESSLKVLVLGCLLRGILRSDLVLNFVLPKFD